VAVIRLGISLEPALAQYARRLGREFAADPRLHERFGSVSGAVAYALLVAMAARHPLAQPLHNLELTSHDLERGYDHCPPCPDAAARIRRAIAEIQAIPRLEGPAEEVMRKVLADGT
jgi:hypothetical protein